ncbi:MarR family winged helix-turn-helix transcriptional regulator [Apibacter sp. HY039]|nr:MarR family transcriptional regulator [Apibacter sp. HY039]
MKDFIYALLKVQTSYRQAFQQKMREKGIFLTFEMFQIMSCLFDEDVLNQQEIANKTFRDKSSLSYILKNLEKKGLISRIEDESDKRNKLIHLTDKGIAMKTEIQEILKNIYGNTLKRVEQQEVLSCIKQLGTIEKAFKESIYE